MSKEYLVYDGGYRHPSAGMMGKWGVFVFTDEALQIYNTMTEKLKSTRGITGVIANFMEDFDYSDKTPDLILKYEDIESVERFKKFLQDPGITFTDNNGVKLTTFIDPKKYMDLIVDKLKAKNTKIEVVK